MAEKIDHNRQFISIIIFKATTIALSLALMIVASSSIAAGDQTQLIPVCPTTLFTVIFSHNNFSNSATQRKVLDKAQYRDGCTYTDFNEGDGFICQYSYCLHEFISQECKACLNITAEFLKQTNPNADGIQYAMENCCVRYEKYKFCEAD